MSEDHVARVRAAMKRQIVHAVLGNDRVAREHGLQVTDLQALHLMVQREDVRTPRQIAAATGMPPSTVTKLLDRLAKAGYITRAADPGDRRRTVIELVPSAIQPLWALYGETDERFDELSRLFTPEELDVIIRYLDAVSEFYAQQ